ncbi:hypothetical protein L484_009791 [Morus notabilis]|uniref:Uncharacterized protein n=1 Tax=Morus notabilis TaxID=981085 RepID=W9S9D3_9ROSA|nr:uncharacterized protein LOC21393109 [Morus notabilis]EXC31941.1 hypothetical protein L484_009791 [Morus notabilis]
MKAPSSSSYASTSSHLSRVFAPFRGFNSSGPNNRNSVTLLRPSKRNSLSLSSRFKSSRLLTVSASNSSRSASSGAESVSQIGSSEAAEGSNEAVAGDKVEASQGGFHVGVGNPSLPIPSVAKLSLSDQAFFLLAFIACTTSVAFASLAVAAVPTLYAMGRAATSLSKLADTAREELPSTMAAIRLSGMEISDLTLELSDLSQEIADGVSKSTQAVQAAEAGIRQIGALARQQTMSMIEERASLPIISLQPVVVGAAKKTSRAVGQATKTFMNMISRGEFSLENEDDSGIDRVD